MMLLSLSDGLATSVPFRNKRYQVVVQQPTYYASPQNPMQGADRLSCIGHRSIG